MTSATTVKEDVVKRYIEGFRAGDHDMILACLTDDVTWEIPPHFKLSGRTAFDTQFCDDFHFRDDNICRLATYQVDRHPPTP